MCRGEGVPGRPACGPAPGAHISGPGTLESLFKTLKGELAKERTYETREKAKQDIFKYIELYHNTQRMHSSLGYMAPCDLERGVV